MTDVDYIKKVLKTTIGDSLTCGYMEVVSGTSGISLTRVPGGVLVHVLTYGDLEGSYFTFIPVSELIKDLGVYSETID